jgi:hypothetical protein
MLPVRMGVVDPDRLAWMPGDPKNRKLEAAAPLGVEGAGEAAPMMKLAPELRREWEGEAIGVC